MKTASLWPIFIAFIALVGVGGTTMLIVRSSGDRGFAVEPDYYARALNWNDAALQRAAGASLGWTAHVQAVRTHQSPEFFITLRDRDQQPLTGANVTATTFHHVSASEHHLLKLMQVQPGTWAAAVPVDHAGHWRILLHIQVDANVLKTEVDSYLAAPSPLETPR